MINLLDLLFPPRCLGCGSIGYYLCKNCRKKITLHPYLCPECDRPTIDGITHPKCLKPWGINALITIFNYEGIIKKAIKQIKYRFVFNMGDELISHIPKETWQLLQNQTQNVVLYPIPLHKDRLNWRGFNQAEKLGKIIAQRLEMPIIDGLLTRSSKRTPQADISHREARIKNAQGLFFLQRKELPQKIILFDDVWTTGATMKEAAKVLKRSGVERVMGLTIAR